MLPVLLCATVAHADAPRPGDDPIAARLFPPELIMQHQEQLGIDDAQRTAILAEVQKTQAAVLPLQWQIQAATSEMLKLLDQSKIDEARVLAQADKVMAIERQLKRAHLGLLVRLRNLLSDAQRARLKALR
jgi:Spy/CpxP family protein refolding chaperone